MKFQKKKKKLRGGHPRQKEVVGVSLGANPPETKNPTIFKTFRRKNNKKQALPRPLTKIKTLINSLIRIQNVVIILKLRIFRCTKTCVCRSLKVLGTDNIDLYKDAMKLTVRSI